MYHDAVLANEAVDALVQDSEGVYVDVTFGGGGHTALILNKLDKKGRLVAFDRDADSLKNIIEDNRLELVNQNFIYMKNYLRYLQVLPVSGILADLGVSSHQFDEPDRGFSFRYDAVLDMRMNTAQELSASEVINNYSEDELYRIFREHADLKSVGKVVRQILEGRNVQRIETTGQLVQLFDHWHLGKKSAKFFAQIFQAIRIEVNDELGALKTLLRQSGEVLKSGGRLVVISYHSIEDRLVKNYLRSGNFRGEIQQDFYGNIERVFDPETSKPVVPADDEIKVNPRARSAKMRVGVKR